MWQYNNKTIRAGKAWSDNSGTQHPSNWMRWSDDRKTSLGMQWKEPAEAFDSKFFWSANNPKDVETLKAQAVKETKVVAGSMLAETDWCVTRKADIGVAIPESIIAERQAIRDAADAIEAVIEGCVTHYEFMTADLNLWPVDEDMV